MPTERPPIQPGKPDPTMFSYTNEVAVHGFKSSSKDWIYKRYWTKKGRRNAYIKYGQRELSAINSILISGIDGVVLGQMSERPFDGFVENVNRPYPDKASEYKPFDVFNSDYEMSILDEETGEQIDLNGRDGFFVVLSDTMADTFRLAFDKHLNSLMEQAQQNPDGKLASLFIRIYQIEEFQEKFQLGTKNFSTIILENIESGATEMASILKTILNIPEVKSKEEFLEIAANSFSLLAEMAMMEGRISRSSLFGQILDGRIYKSDSQNGKYFTLIKENGRKRLDFSDHFKSLVREIDKNEPRSGVSERLGCPAIRVVKGNNENISSSNSVIKGMWNLYLKFGGKIYDTFHSLSNPNTLKDTEGKEEGMEIKKV